MKNLLLLVFQIIKYLGSNHTKSSLTRKQYQFQLNSKQNDEPYNLLLLHHKHLNSINASLFVGDEE